jgi:hypothetical protein
MKKGLGADLVKKGEAKDMEPMQWSLMPWLWRPRSEAKQK